MFYIFILFFFFKQKTAYEMRISDWSSDVCSSDLGEDRLRPAHHGSHRLDRDARDIVVWLEPGERGAAAHHAEPEHQRLGIGNQIGRASCRERVCQYV